jgi:S-formylglutathione hydrolase FrmB
MGALRFAFKYPQMFSSVFAFNPAVDDNASNVMINEPGLMAAMFNNDPTLFDQNTVFTLANNNAANIPDRHRFP